MWFKKNCYEKDLGCQPISNILNIINTQNIIMEKSNNFSLKELEECANELISSGNSREKSEGHGMMRVIKAVKEERSNAWFFKSEKILKDGYWYVKVKDLFDYV